MLLLFYLIWVWVFWICIALLPSQGSDLSPNYGCSLISMMSRLFGSFCWSLCNLIVQLLLAAIARGYCVCRAQIGPSPPPRVPSFPRKERQIFDCTMFVLNAMLDKRTRTNTVQNDKLIKSNLKPQNRTNVKKEEYCMKHEIKTHFWAHASADGGTVAHRTQ